MACRDSVTGRFVSKANCVSGTEGMVPAFLSRRGTGRRAKRTVAPGETGRYGKTYMQSLAGIIPGTKKHRQRFTAGSRMGTKSALNKIYAGFGTYRR